MLDAALKFIAAQVNAHLLKRTGSALGQVSLGPVVDDAGKWVVAPNTVQLTLVNVEQEPTLRNVPGERVQIGATLVLQPAPLKLNATVLFSASFADYAQALRQLSHVLIFFQSHPLFAADSDAGLPPPLERLSAELVSHTPEQLNQMWTMLGAKHLPSVAYRLRLVVLQDSEPLSTGAPITSVDAALGQR